MTLSHTQAYLLAKKSLLEFEIAEKQKELEQLTQQIKQLPKTIQEVVERVRPQWLPDHQGIPSTADVIKLCLRGYTHSEPAARQLQALNDLQNWCKALNEHFGSDGKKWYALDESGHFDILHVEFNDETLFYAFTPFHSRAAAEYAITCPDFCEALKILYTPVD